MQICLTNADYQIGYIVRSFEYIDSQNTLADGSCCDSTCSDDIPAACLPIPHVHQLSGYVSVSLTIPLMTEKLPAFKELYAEMLIKY